MIKKLRKTAVMMVGVITTLAISLQAKIALAEGKTGIPTNVTPETFGQKLVELISAYATPLGGAIVLGAVVFGGFKLLTQAYQAEERARTMGGLLYVLIGAILVGGSLFFAGIFVGIGSQFK